VGYFAGSFKWVACIKRRDSWSLMVALSATLAEVEVFLRHRWCCDLDQQPVFEPELDDVEGRLVAPHAAAEGLCTPALARTDPLDLFRLARHRQQYVERPSVRRCRIFRENDLTVTVRLSSVARSG
jgi:hypothetical protein